MTTHLGEYLSLVLPWGDEAGTFKVVMNDFTTKEGEKKFAHAAATDIDSLERLIRSRCGFGANVWVALAGYREARNEMTKDGFHKISRTQANVALHRCLYVDLDVKAGAYTSQQEAYDDLHRACAEQQVPDPTLFVNSGNGLHAYWCFNPSIDTNRWQPMALALVTAMRHGRLQFDQQCTVDAARVLRPPETFNRKTTPPNPTTLYQPKLVYTPEQMEAALARFAGPRVVSTLPQGSQTAAASSWAASGFTTSQAKPADMWAIADAGCGVFADAIDTHGAKHGQPLWHLLSLAATFDEDPAYAIHEISSGHPSYTVADTGAMLHRKLTERANNPRIGWPSCRQFSVMHPACQSCQFLAAGKTPFHIAPVSSAQPAAAPSPDLPAGYWRVNDIVSTKVRDADGNESAARVLDYPILSGALREDTGALVFKTIIGRDNCDVEVPSAATISPVEIARALALSNVLVKGYQQKPLKEFIVSWTQHLQDMRQAKLRPVSLGWTEQNEFVYGGKIFGAQAPREAYVPDPSAMRVYTPKGDLATWRNAANIIVAQQNPGMQCMLATAFAGPLVKFTGQSGLLFSAYSVESGIGKSTAMKVGQAVWGDPIRAMNALSDTENAVMKKLSDLRHLPLNWDELKTRNDIDKLVSIVFRLGQGKDKARLNRDARASDIGSFATMLVTASNDSLADAITRATTQTAAGALRCFEINVRPSSVRYITSQVSTLIAKLENNYGEAGLVYAEFLGANTTMVQQSVEKTQADLEQALQATQDERFWIATLATILIGATIAKQIGLVDFDVPAMQLFLVDTMQRLRGDRRHNVIDFATEDNVEELMQRLVSENLNRHLIITDKIYGGGGRPRSGSVKAIGDVTTVTQLWAQFAPDENKLRVATGPFSEWLTKAGYSPSSVYRRLGAHAKVTHGRGVIAAGVHYFDGVNRMRTRIVDIQFPPSMVTSSAYQPHSHGSDEPSEHEGSTAS